LGDTYKNFGGPITRGEVDLNDNLRPEDLTTMID